MTAIRPIALSGFRDKLLEAGERLFAERGLNGASLRRISAEAGTRNNYAVQSAFGDADGLLRAILAKRATAIEHRRAELLSSFVGSGEVSLRQLLEVIFLPIIEDSRPQHPAVFAKLNLTLLISPQGWEPLDEAFFEKPFTRRTLDLLAAANAGIDPPLTWSRMRFASIGLLGTIVWAYSMNETPPFYKAATEDAFAMAVAAISAPPSDNLREAAQAGYGRAKL